MKILGIDPGTAIVGWALIQKEGAKIRLVDCGAIKTASGQEEATRLASVYAQLCALIAQHAPHELAIEQLYFATNVKTAISVAQSRGVIILCAAQQNMPVISYSPLAVKKTITGDGTADKKQIQYMLAKLLPHDPLPKLDDITDAVAIALTHAYTNRKIARS